MPELKRKFRIGFTIRLFTPGSGGLQHHAAELVGQLRALGHDPVVVTRAVTRVPSYQDAFYFSEARNIRSDQAHIVRHPRWLNPLMWVIYKCVHRPMTRDLGIRLYIFVYAGQIVRALRGVDVIHHIGQGSEMIGFAAAAAAKKLKVPFVVQPTAHPGQWGDAAIDLELYRRAARLLVHTEYERDALRSLGLDGAFDIVGNGIADRADGSAERFRTRHCLTGPIILFVGRKSADKGYPLLLDAFAKIREAHPEAALIALGPPGKPPAADAPGLLDLGFADEGEKHDALAACDVLCVPSEGESFGLVFMEAARYGKVSVARNLPVLRELLGRKGAALLVGPADATSNKVEVNAAELARVLKWVLEQPGEARAIGEKARCVSDDFLWPKVVSRFERAYASAMEGFH